MIRPLTTCALSAVTAGSSTIKAGAQPLYALSAFGRQATRAMGGAALHSLRSQTQNLTFTAKAL